MNVHYRNYELPWTLPTEQERRFRKILLHVFGVTCALALLVPWLPVPEPDLYEAEEIPPRFAKLILEKPVPPPPPVVQPVEPEPEAVVAVTDLEKVVEPAIVEPGPQPKPAPTRKKAATAGLLPFADELAELRDNAALVSIADDRALTGAVGEGSRNERSLITSSVGTGSGGINTAALSRDTGGGRLAGRSTTQIAAPLAGNGRGAAVRSGNGQRASRSREEIEMTFDRNKGAIYALYNRALREDPALEGKLVLRLTIAPSGEVTMCEIVSSDLGAPELERKLIARVKLFRFEAKDVEAVTTTKPIDFFPA